MNRSWWIWAGLVLALVAGGCAGPGPRTGEVVVEERSTATTPADPGVESPAPRAGGSARGGTAVAALERSAIERQESGDANGASALLERALRIDPRNPRLWHQLAVVRLRQGRFQQAEALATKSNTFAGDDRTLRIRNWELIARARAGAGDSRGAATARARADALRQSAP